MGSSTLQCALSRETIKEGDHVVTLLLEPNNPNGNISHINQQIKHQTQHFKLGSLPIFGKYADYGQIDAQDPESLAIRMSKALYDYDFSRETNDEAGSRGDQLMLGGCTTEYDETHTLQWTVSRAAYEALMSKVDLDAMEQSLLAGDQDKQLKTLFHEQLLENVSKIHAPDKTRALTRTLAFTKALNDLGIPFHIQSKRTSQTAAYDDKARIKIHAALKQEEMKGKVRAAPTSAVWTCAVTGDALAPGDKAYILPIDDRLDLDEDSNAVYFDEHKVTGMYALAAPEVAVTMTDNHEFTLEGPLSELQKRFIQGQVVEQGTEIEEQTLINKLASGELSYKDRFDNYHRNIMVLSEPAYQALVKNNRPALVNSFDQWRETVEMLKQMHEASPQTIEEVKDLIPEGYPHMKWLKGMFYDAEVQKQRDEELKNSPLGDLVKDKKKYTPEKIKDHFKFQAKSYFFKMPGNGDRWSKNSFSNLFRDDGELSNILSYVFKGGLLSNFGSKDLDSVKKSLDFMAVMANEFNSTIHVVNGLNSFGLSIAPSHRVESGLTVEDQRALNQSMRTATTKAIIERRQEWDEECSM